MRLHARLWPIGVVAALAVTVGANLILLRVASDPAGTAVEPDYYRKAVAWDSTLAERALSQALGWSLAARLERPGPEGVPLRARLERADRQPIVGAIVHVEAIHNLSPGRSVVALLREIGPGEYAAVLRTWRPGLWELRFDVRRAADRYTVVRRADAAAP